MVLSRAFALLLGTTVFVMIWTMQDENHAALRMGTTAEIRASTRVSENHPEVAAVPTSRTTAERDSATQSDPVLWVFAAEPNERVAAK